MTAFKTHLPLRHSTIVTLALEILFDWLVWWYPASSSFIPPAVLGFETSFDYLSSSVIPSSIAANLDLEKLFHCSGDSLQTHFSWLRSTIVPLTLEILFWLVWYLASSSFVPLVFLILKRCSISLLISWTNGTRKDEDFVSVRMIDEPTHTCMNSSTDWKWCAESKNHRDCARTCGFSTGGSAGVEKR